MCKVISLANQKEKGRRYFVSYKAGESFPSNIKLSDMKVTMSNVMSWELIVKEYIDTIIF